MWVRFDLQKPSHYLRLGWWETKVCFEKALQCMCHGNSSKETFIAWQALPLTSLSKSQRKLFCFHKAAPAERCVIGWFNFGKIKTCSKQEVTSILQKRKGNYEKMTARSLNISYMNGRDTKSPALYIETKLRARILRVRELPLIRVTTGSRKSYLVIRGFARDFATLHANLQVVLYCFLFSRIFVSDAMQSLPEFVQQTHHWVVRAALNKSKKWIINFQW